MLCGKDSSEEGILEQGFPAKLVLLLVSENLMQNKFCCFAKLTGHFAKFCVLRNNQFRMFHYF
jgi:hypothetical protein